MTDVRVIALGQAAAGDDGVGLAVLEAVRARALPPGVELLRAADETELIELVRTPARVVLVDAVLGTPPGEVVELDPERLAPGGRALSTHGVGVVQALALARVLAPDEVAGSIRIVGITIAPPAAGAWGLSAAVAAAVPRAAARVLALAGVPDRLSSARRVR